MVAEEEQACPLSQEEGVDGWVLVLPLQAHHAMGSWRSLCRSSGRDAEGHLIRRIFPDRLKDKDYLLHDPRPPRPSFQACFKSIFCIHTQNGIIWIHLLGFVLSLFGNLDHAQTKYVLHGPSTGEGGFWNVLFGCSALPQFLLALSHRLLSFRESLSDFFQVS